MLKHVILAAVLCHLALAEAPVQGVKPTNVLGGSEQHASFSFIRPGLTQTSFAFAGPSSHQSFSSTIGNPYLAQRVHPNLAQALAYRNPGLGYFPIGPIAGGYASVPVTPALAPSVPSAPLPYQAPLDQALAYQQQLQQLQHPQLQNYAAYQTQLAQLLATRQAQLQSQQLQQQVQTQSQQVSEDVQLQTEQPQPQNLLGVRYSSAPSVAHVKVSGNGYKFDF